MSGAVVDPAAASNGSRELWGPESAELRAAIGAPTGTPQAAATGELAAAMVDSPIPRAEQMLPASGHSDSTADGDELPGASGVARAIEEPAPVLELAESARVLKVAKTTLEQVPIGASKAAPANEAVPRSQTTRLDAMVGARMSRLFDRDLTGIEVPPGSPTAREPSASLPAAVMRSAERAEIDPAAAELVTRARRGGVPLEDTLRSELEASLGARLDGVRVHTGAEADAAARALGATAFAIGDDVVFRDGAYDPHGRNGQQLIAHEVAHTVQARLASPAGNATVVSQPGDAIEREADAFADAFVRRPHGVGGVIGASGVPASASAQLEQAPRSAGGETSGSAALAGPATSGATIYRQSGPAEAQIHRSSRGSVQRPEVPPEVARRYDAFLDGVYAAAQRIVSANIQAVEAWRSYVLDQLSPRQMGAQVFATGFEQLQQQAVANNAGHLLAPWACCCSTSCRSSCRRSRCWPGRCTWPTAPTRPWWAPIEPMPVAYTG